MADASGAGVSALRLKVKTLAPAEYSLSLDEAATVGDLKNEVARHSNVEAERQRILFCGRVLADNEKKLVECGLKDGHTLHMVERPPDAPSQPQNDVPPPPQQQQQQRFPGLGVQRIAIGTINAGPGGVAATENPANVDSLLSGLMTAIGNSLGRGNVGTTAGLSAAQTNGQPIPPLAGIPGVQVQQVEINIDAGGPGAQGGAVPPYQPPPHPLRALDDFISQMRTTMDSGRGRSPVVTADDPGPGTSNARARHFAVECDLCGACPINGARYKSLSHDNYDVCQACVGTQAARAHEPFVQVEVPLCNQLNMDTILSSRANANAGPGANQGGAQSQQNLERLRSAVSSILGTADASDSRDGGEGEEGSGGGERYATWSRDRLQITALHELLRRTRSLLSTEATDFMAEQISDLDALGGLVDGQEEGEAASSSRHGVQGRLIYTSSMLNALGGLLIELGRLCGGTMSNHLGYVSHNSSQVNIPPPVSGLDRLFFGGIPGGVFGEPRPPPPGAVPVNLSSANRRFPPQATNPGRTQPPQPQQPLNPGAPPASAPAPAPSVPEPAAPPAPIPPVSAAPALTPAPAPAPAPVPGLNAAASGDVGLPWASGQAPGQAVTMDNLDHMMNDTMSENNHTMSELGEMMSDSLGALTSFLPSVTAAMRETRLERTGEREGEREPRQTMGWQDLEREIERAIAARERQAQESRQPQAEEANAQAEGQAAAETAGVGSAHPKEEEGVDGDSESLAETLQEKASEEAKEETETAEDGDEGNAATSGEGAASTSAAPGAGEETKTEEKEERKKGPRGLGLGMGLGRRPKPSKKVSEGKETQFARPLDRLRRPPPRPKPQASSSSGPSGGPNPLLGMMNQMLGGLTGAQDSDDDYEIEEEVDFEEEVAEVFGEEEGGKWMSIIESDQLEQEEMCMRQGFSDAYLSVDNLDE